MRHPTQLLLFAISLVSASVPHPTKCLDLRDRSCNQGTSVWLDVDTGNDDSMGILTAFFNDQIDVVGITTSYGNTCLKYATSNTIRVLSTLGFIDVPVVQGSRMPLVKPHVPEDTVHGSLGMFGAEELEEKFNPIIDDSEGTDTVYGLLKNHTLSRGQKTTMIVVGPQTNMAKLLRRHPDVSSYIDRIVFMGGTLGPGNITPYSEFNIWTDAEALQIVIEESSRMEIEIVMIPLEATESNLLAPYHIEFIKNMPWKWTKWVGSLLERLRDATLQYGDPHPTLHDAIAVSYVLNPNLFKGEHMHIRVNTDEVRYGQTQRIPGHQPNVLVMTEVDGVNFWLLFFRSLVLSATYSS